MGALVLAVACGGNSQIAQSAAPPSPTPQPSEPSAAQLAAGQETFRYETFGNESAWTDAWKINVEVAAHIDPVTALTVAGLKVDSEAVAKFPEVVAAIQNHTLDLTNPATTVALLKMNAVVGLKGLVETDPITKVSKLVSLGITCALCHSTVDDSFSKANGLPNGIGKRLDGWPNRQLNPGLIKSLSPTWSAQERAMLQSWGPGKFETRTAFDGKNNPIVIPPAYGLKDINKITVTGDGDNVAYWNRIVATVEMGGHGNVSDPRIGLNHTDTLELVEPKLANLGFYQLSLASPAPPAGSFDAPAAARGQLLFKGQANCISCHSGPQFTDANTKLHPAKDSMAEPELNNNVSYASRSATGLYRTSPLKGVWSHAPYFHDGRAATLEDVVKIYNTRMNLGLTSAQIADVAQYVKSL